MKTGIQLIAEERERQITQEGWTSEHDDTHINGALKRAAACYAMGEDLPIFRGALGGGPGFEGEARIQRLWPWGQKWWKPSRNTDRQGTIRNLVKAGALIAAEIDRLQRQALPRPQRGEGKEGEGHGN